MALPQQKPVNLDLPPLDGKPRQQEAIQRMRQRLRELRLARGLSLEDLAKASGIDKGNLSKYEGGAKPRVPKATHLVDIAAALKVHVGELFDDAPVASTSAEREALGILRALSTLGRAAVLAYAQGRRDEETSGKE